MNWLLDSSSFVTRNHCGPGWSPWLVVVYQISNLVIFLAYVSIPISILILYSQKRKELPSPHIFLLFIAFIVLCGLTHLCDLTVFHWAPYRLFTAIDVLTALVSAATAVVLPTIVRALVRLPSRDFVHRINNQLQEEVFRRGEAERELARRNEKLRERVAALEGLLKSNSVKTLEDLLRTNQWIHERNAAMQELTKILSELEAI